MPTRPTFNDEMEHEAIIVEELTRRPKDERRPIVGPAFRIVLSKELQCAVDNQFMESKIEERKEA